MIRMRYTVLISYQSQQPRRSSAGGGFFASAMAPLSARRSLLLPLLLGLVWAEDEANLGPVVGVDLGTTCTHHTARALPSEFWALARAFTAALAPS